MNVRTALILGIAWTLIATPALAQQGRRGEQDAAYRATRDGEVRSLRSIESNIVPSMKARGSAYIGAEFDGQQSRYRLKFVRDGSVIWVDVDGRSGAIMSRAGE